MCTIGIVVEYNPFHNGHIYQIERIRSLYPESVIVVAMSSHFTERGEISVLDKWDKTEIVLNNGIDVVLEIPFPFTNQSADTFSYAALKLLNEFKVNVLFFGSESNNLSILSKAANIQINNKDFDSKVKEYINLGYNYPTSLSKAIYDFTKLKIKDSNDLLGISYIKQIIINDYNMRVKTIERTNSFLDIENDGEIISALNIREKIKKGIDITPYVPKEVPNRVRKYDENELFKLIKYKIISEKDNLINYHLVTEGIEKRLYEKVIKSNNLTEFIDSVKTKRFTFNRIRRILINILIGFTKEEAKKYNDLEYIRVMGLTKRGKEHLNSIKRDCKLPIITKFKKFDMLDLELKATQIYGLIMNDENIAKKEVKNHVILK